MFDELDKLDANGAKLFLTVIACGLSRFAARGRAEKWIARNFVPHSRPHSRTLGGLKADFELANQGEYLHRADMQRAFEANQIRVVGERVYAKGIRCSASAAKRFIHVTGPSRGSAKTAARSSGTH